MFSVIESKGCYCVNGFGTTILDSAKVFTLHGIGNGASTVED